MADTCTLVIETQPPIPMTCADGTGIEKGAILKLTDDMTAVAASGDGDVVAGIAAAEKIASDGNTKIPVYRGGIFKGTSDGGSTVGDALQTSTDGAGEVMTQAAGSAAGTGLGIAMETITDGQTFLFELRPGVVTET